MARNKGRIGVRAGGGVLALPDDAVTQGFGILARRRSGKSMLAGVMAETFCRRGDPWVCLDPASAWWGIKYLDANGKPGKASPFEVLVVGGKYGDVPLDESMGASLADIIVETDINCVVDMKEFGMKARKRFVTAFAERLYQINETPRHVFLEEAHEFVPQSPRFPEQMAVLGAVERLVKGGGGLGLGFTLISQRPAEVNKAVLEQIDNLFALRMSGPNDLKAMKAWFEHNVGDKEQMAEILSSLPSFKPGDAWLLSPEWLEEVTRLKVDPRVAYHAGRTPKRGDAPLRPRKVDVSKAVGKFRDAAERRQIDIADEADVKKQLDTALAELKRWEGMRMPLPRRPGAAKEATPEVAPPEVRIERDPADADRIAQLEADGEALRVTFGKYQVDVDDAVGRARNWLTARVQDAIDDANFPERVEVPKDRSAVPPGHPGTFDGTATTAKAAAVNGKGGSIKSRRVLMRDVDSLDGLRGGAVKILRELASRYPLTYTKSQVGQLTGFAPRGGTYRQYVNDLARRGLIEKVGNELTATEAGLAAAGEVPQAPTTHHEVMAMWERKLRAGCYKILQQIAAAGAGGIARETLADATGLELTGGTFRQYVGTLKRNDLVKEDATGIRAGELLWP